MVFAVTLRPAPTSGAPMPLIWRWQVGIARHYCGKPLVTRSKAVASNASEAGSGGNNAAAIRLRAAQYGQVEALFWSAS
jgi:hypothetical protein